jgi:hypothetical protein
MNKKSIYIYIAASLAMIIPAPGRFAIGLVLVVELNFLMVFGTCFRYLLEKMNIGQLAVAILTILLIAATMLFRQVLVLCVPETALQLGFVIYLPTVSSFFIGYMFGNEIGTLAMDLKNYLYHSFSYSLFALLFFLFRDIVGFGTITYISSIGITEKVLFNRKITILSFFATIPGALVCAAVILIIYVFLINKAQVIERAEKVHD